MGSVSAKKLREVVTNVKACLAIEIMTAAAGVDQRAPLSPSRGVRAALELVRRDVAPMTGDRPLYQDIARVIRMLDANTLLQHVTDTVGTIA